MKVTIALMILCCGLVACGGQNPAALPLPPMNNLDPENQQHVNAMWPVLLEKCPGLSKYATDLTVAGAFLLEYEDRKWVNLDIGVKDSPRRIPGAYFATGQQCHFSLYRDGQIGVTKRPCMAICKDRDPAAFGTDELMI